MSSIRDRIKAKRQAISDKDASRIKTYKFQNGKTVFRLLPGKVDPDTFYEEIGVHWIKDKKANNVTAVGDRQICFGEPCPVREAIELFIRQAKEAGDDGLLKIGKDMLAKPRYFANIVVVKAPGEFEKDKAVVAEFPERAWDTILSQLQDHFEDLGDNFDVTKDGPLALEKGTLFVMERSGTSMKDTKYNPYIAGKAHAIAPAVLEAAVDLTAYKRSWFDERTRKALATLGAMTGVSMNEIAERLAAPSGKALPAPKDGWDEEETITAIDEDDETPSNPAGADDTDVDTLLDELDDL